MEATVICDGMCGGGSADGLRRQGLPTPHGKERQPPQLDQSVAVGWRRR